MYFLNRAALVLVAKQEFVDWIHSTPDDLDFITLKGIHEQGPLARKRLESLLLPACAVLLMTSLLNAPRHEGSRLSG